MTTTGGPPVTETPVAMQPVGTPGLLVPVFFGFLGAWWASRKAKKLGLTRTKHYWIAGAISTALGYAPILFLVIASMIFASAMGDASTLDNPAASPPLTGSSGNANNAPVAPATPIDQSTAVPSPANTTKIISESSPVGERLFSADAMSNYTPIPSKKSDNINYILGGFNSSWLASCMGNPGGLPNQPLYLWAFVYDTSGPFYTKWGSDEFADSCGKFTLANPSDGEPDENALNNLTDRKYKVNILINGTESLGVQTLHIKLIHAPEALQDHWMMMDLS